MKRDILTVLTDPLALYLGMWKEELRPTSEIHTGTASICRDPRYTRDKHE